MSAQNTDNFMNAAADWVGAIGGGGVADGIVTTIPLVSAINLPTGTGIEITIDRVNNNGTATPSLREVVKGVVSGSNLISCIRGVEGTAQSHASGAVVELMMTADMWNAAMNAMLIGHSQAGAHSLAGIDGIHYAADSGSANAYAVTLSPVPSAYFSGMVVRFVATNPNTTASTLAVNGFDHSIFSAAGCEPTKL